MTVNYTTNLGLGQPVTGTESGTWGDDVNNSVTSYLDIAIAGGLAITITTTDVTLSLTQGTSSATNIGSTTAQYAILNISGAMTAARNLILPSSSRQYVINNNTTGGFALTVKGAATTGVTMVNGESAHIYWNGSDYAKLSNAPGGAGTFTNLTYTGTLTGSTGVIAIGTNQIYKDSSGNVGIGTSSPGYKLDVANSDAQVYGVRVGRGAGAISTNTVLGNSVLPSNSTGSSNTAIGYRAGNPITTGISNTFLGPDTGYGLQSSASYNTVLGAYALNASASVGPTGAVAVGYSAGYYLKNADYSVVIGYQAGALGGFYQTNTTVAIGYQASQYNYGAYNTAIGYQANYGNAVNSNSFNITAVGHSALFSNTASYNAAFGNVAGYSNTSGTNNTFIGSGAAYSGTTGSDNTALGLSSLYSNQTNSNITSIGSQAQYYMRADGNTSIGYQSLYGSATPASNTGGYNTVIGYRAVFNTLTTGAYNTVIGASAGYSLTTGSQNVLIGSSSTASTAAGYAITTGQYNVVIGPYTGNSGGLDIRTASNFVVFADGQSNIRQVFNSSGVSLTAQGAPASISSAVTLTGAQVLGGLINTTGTTYNVTMPLGTSLDTALVGCPTDFAFNFSIVNTASGTIGITVNTGITSLGSMGISTGTSATYRVRKTAANTFVMYRI
jgi:hypothetical protein